MNKQIQNRKVWESEIEERVGEVLCYIWDPIGSSRGGSPEGRDEYDDYIAPICQALMLGDSKEQLVKMLSGYEVDRMGLDEPDIDNCNRVADVLLEWKRYLNEQGRL